MRISLLEEYGAFLTRAQPATQLCARVLAESARDAVVLDYAGVVQMSPSFTNALFFNLLHRMNVDDLRRRVRIENAAPYILDAINAAIARKLEHRAELTSYLSCACPGVLNRPQSTAARRIGHSNHSAASGNLASAAPL